ncbi:hypothetical protein ACEYXF_38080 [Streptomyces asiaticus]|uniref:hypothetical protein n=1 Tax=Streptomyces asiaticus TaxID=114695 RepID=UPI0039BDE457
MRMQVRLTGDLGEISVLALRDVLSNTVSLLNELDPSAGQDDVQRDWVVTGLNEGSACVAIAAAHPEGERALPRALEAVRELHDRPAIPLGANEFAVRKVIKLHQLTGKRGLTGIEFSEVGDKLARVTSINAVVAAHAREAIKEVSRTRSAFRGRLDKINLRARSPEFSLFDEHRGMALRCHLGDKNDADLLEQVKSSVGAFVSARGDLKRNSLRQPIHMRVDRLRVIEQPSITPTLHSIVGVAPDWTEGLSSVDFVSLQRRSSSQTNEGGEGRE